MKRLSLEKLVLDAQKLGYKEGFQGKWDILTEMYEKRLQIYKTNKIQPVIELKPTIGIEFYPPIKNEKDLIKRIMWLHLYLPQVFFSETQFYEFGSALDDKQLFDRRNMGSVVGMAILGMIGFLALGFTIMGMIAGGLFGVMLGRYAGKRIKKTYQQNSNLTEFDIYCIRIKCFIKWGIDRGNIYRYNVNLLRFISEKLLLEIKPILHYKQFKYQYQNESQKLLKKMSQVFQNKHFIDSLILSLKMSEEYLRILHILANEIELERQYIEEYQHFKDFRLELEICLIKSIDNVLKPLIFLLDETKIKQKDLLQLKQQIQYFILQKDILQLSKDFPDPQLRISYIKLLAEQMKQPFKSRNQLNDIKFQNFKELEQAELEIYQQQIKNKDKTICIVQLEQIQENELSSHSPPLKSQISGNISEIQPLQLEQSFFIDNNNINNSNKLLQIQLKQHPNIILIQAIKIQPDFSISNLTPSKSLSQQDIQLILKPDSQILNQNQQINNQISIQYTDETQKKFDIFYQFYQESTEDWECVTTKDDIYIYKAMKPGCGSVFLKGHAFIKQIDKEIVFQAVYNKQFRTKWDKIMQGFDIVKNEREDIDIMYYYVVPPIPIVSTREWLQRRVLRYNFPQQDQICLLFYSIELQEIPINKNRVRAHTEIAGYVFESIASGTKITFISNNDIRGSIPKLLVNHASAKGPFGWFGNLRKACIQYLLYNGDINKIIIK